MSGCTSCGWIWQDWLDSRKSLAAIEFRNRSERKLRDIGRAVILSPETLSPTAGVNESTINRATSFSWLNSRGLTKAHARTAAVFVDEVYACLLKARSIISSGAPGLVVPASKLDVLSSVPMQSRCLERDSVEPSNSRAAPP